MQKKLLLTLCILLAIYLTGCSISMDEEPNPKTMDFTGRDTVGEDNSFDSTNGVEINSDNTSKTRDEKRMQINRKDQPERIINSQTKLTLEEITADQVALIDGVASAIILETDNNAYVAVRLNGNSNKVNDDLRKKITKVVMANVKEANAAYISANRDFYQRMENYAQAIKTDKPTTNFLDDFAETIRRIFPDAK